MSRVAWFVVAALSLRLIAHADQPLRTPLVGEHQQDWSLLDPAVVKDVAIPPPGATPESVNHAVVSNIIYLNRCAGACTITKTDYPRSSATGNQTWIVGGDMDPAGTQFHITEFAFSQTVWDQVVQCVKDVYAPYNVQIVTEDPSPAPHHEAIVAGTSTDFGIPPDVAQGRAELGAGFCSPKDNAISLNIANDHTPQSGMTLAQNICWTIAQETAHSWGLDHEIECTDALTYDFSSCGQRFFRNKNSACGEVGITGAQLRVRRQPAEHPRQGAGGVRPGHRAAADPDDPRRPAHGGLAVPPRQQDLRHRVRRSRHEAHRGRGGHRRLLHVRRDPAVNRCSTGRGCDAT